VSFKSFVMKDEPWRGVVRNLAKHLKSHKNLAEGANIEDIESHRGNPIEARATLYLSRERNLEPCTWCHGMTQKCCLCVSTTITRLLLRTQSGVSSGGGKAPPTPSGDAFIFSFLLVPWLALFCIQQLFFLISLYAPRHSAGCHCIASHHITSLCWLLSFIFISTKSFVLVYANFSGIHKTVQLFHSLHSFLHRGNFWVELFLPNPSTLLKKRSRLHGANKLNWSF
jgi:hypothetical protein